MAASTPGLRRALARLAWPDARDDETAVGKLRYATRTILAWRDFTAPWRREMFPRRVRIDELISRLPLWPNVYHATRTWHKIRPVAAAFVVEKPTQ